MRTFEDAIRRIEEYRICLERDAERGIIATGAVPMIDDCYRTLETVLRSARIELEGAGVQLGRGSESGTQVVTGCALLSRRMFRRMYRERDADRLRSAAVAIASEGRVLMERLWARLDAVAA